MAMTLRKQRNLMASGFVLYRLELEKRKIMVARTPGNWRKYGEYRTQEECRKIWGFLMANDYYISE